MRGTEPSKVHSKQVSQSHQYIVDLLKDRGFTNFTGGIQLFINQYEDEYSISINHMSTGVHVKKSTIDEADLFEDELIRVCKTWDFKN